MQKAIPRLQDLVPLLVEKRSLVKIKGKIEVSKTSLRLSIRIIIRKLIILLIALSFLKSRTSYSFDNFYMNDCKYGG